MKPLYYLILLVLISKINVAQPLNLAKYYTHTFVGDSLIGFDEVAAKRSALSEGFFGEEFKVKMYQLKRSYINTKYGIISYKQSFINTTGKLNSVVTAACLNDDFESSSAGTITFSNQVSGWICQGGSNFLTGGSCALTGCCVNAPSQSQLITAGASGYVDPIIGAQYPIYSVFGVAANTGSSVNPSIANMYGSNFLRLNNSTNDYSIEKLTRTFAVTPSNALFQLAYIGVHYSGHSCCDAAAFQVKFTNATTSTTLACPGFSTVGLSSACSTSSTANYYVAGSNSPANVLTTFMYNKWQILAFDLSAYIGQNMTIDLIATDCTGGAHYSYTYVDTKCAPFDMIVNGVSFPSIGSSISVSNCIGTGSISIVAPAGLGPYSWAGLSVTPPYNTPLLTNQTYTANSASSAYTLTMNPDGACAPIINTITITTNTSSPTVSVNSGVVCSGQSFTMVPSGASTYTYSNGSNVISPTTNTSVNVLGTDSLGCISNTAISSISVTPAPTVNIMYSLNTICLGQSATLTASGANTYNWNTFATSNIIVVSPSVSTIYSVTVTDTSTGCSNTGAVIINISSCMGLTAQSGIVAQSLNIYPNPANSIINVEFLVFNNEPYKIEILNSLGQVLQTANPQQPITAISVKELPSGMYQLKISEGSTQKVIKFIKN